MEFFLPKEKNDKYVSEKLKSPPDNRINKERTAEKPQAKKNLGISLDDIEIMEQKESVDDHDDRGILDNNDLDVVSDNKDLKHVNSQSEPANMKVSEGL